MLGKGSVSHNTRKFKAENIDSERTKLNIEYCYTPIKKVYHELFDDALKRYNDKQTRNDRKIENYYEKIRTGKQEKLFHEIIVQVGNKDDMAAITKEGQIAANVLNDYMLDFQKRNPYLKVFSAHLHMDEATPHLHIDFVPFTTGSKRGLDTRVSLKQALENQGFKGGSRSETEWNQWTFSEKQQLAKVMEKHGIEWEQLGNHDKHLSVENYKKEQRIKEVASLDKEIREKYFEIDAIADKKHEITTNLQDTTIELDILREKNRFIDGNAKQYDEKPEYQLPEPKPMMTAKT
jgi:hypothetical protein